MHEKKLKGDIGVAYAIARLTELGFTVSLPLSEHSSYDLIYEKDNICKTGQVRYTTPKDGKLVVKLRSVWASKKGNHIKKHQPGDFDVLIVFNPENKEVYFVPESELIDIEQFVTLRLIPTKGNRVYKTRYTKDYLAP